MLCFILECARKFQWLQNEEERTCKDSTGTLVHISSQYEYILIVNFIFQQGFLAECDKIEACISDHLSKIQSKNLALAD